MKLAVFDTARSLAILACDAVIAAAQLANELIHDDRPLHRHDGADRLADLEAETEVAEPMPSLWFPPEGMRPGTLIFDQPHPKDRSGLEKPDGSLGLGDILAGIPGLSAYYPSGHPDWVDWATPAIQEILAEHEPMPWLAKVIECQCPDKVILEDFGAWREHVAPEIALHLKAAAAGEISR